ncbi:MAG: HEAT repeat domain-containing protein [Spirochaetaceae bacterium]|jgi:HEAT repeat protein|nr:HEAT repeat domain-containing protein [Spirochaetaceae bacterium]
MGIKMKLNAVYFAVFLFFAGAFFAAAAPEGTASENDASENDAAAAEAAASAVEEERLRETIKYGTDNEISDLIKKLRGDKIYYLDDDLLQLAKKTRNQNIIIGIFSFFSERGQIGLEEPALAILNGRENETPQKISAALDYLGSVKEKNALPVITEIISSDDVQFDSMAIRVLGKIIYKEPDAASNAAAADKASGGADSGGMAEITEILIDYYNNRSPNDDTRQSIISAAGSAGGEAAAPFLLEIINNDELSAPIRMSALDGAAKLGSSDLIDSVLAASSSGDPNIRFAAVEALGSFSGEAVDTAILESFRDTYFKTRLAAIRSAKKRRIKEAIPYLRYRAEKDEASAIKEAAVLALGDFHDTDADSAIFIIFSDTKNSDSLRSLCAEALIKNNAGKYAENIITKLDEAKVKKQTALYKGLLKALSFAKTDKVENLTARLFASTDVAEKFYALDMTANNRFTAFKSEVEKLTQEKNLSLSRRAKTTLEKLS